MSEVDLKLISVSGLDAEKFLQGQLTCDVQTLADGGIGLGAHCNAKGRVVSLFSISRQNGNFYLEMPTDVIEIAVTQLKKYAVFSKNVRLEITSSTNSDPTWHRQHIEAGIPRLYPQTIGEFLPHSLNLVELGAVSFNKGCYTGQEIIARMQHRGKLKQHMQLLQLPTTANITPGKELYAPNTNELLGQVVDYVTLDTYQLVLVITRSNTTP